MPARPSRRYEGVWRRRGYTRVAGLDEVGRGCLAGPVVAAAVVLGRCAPDGIRDSKCLSAARREQLLAALLTSGAACAWACASPAEIDRINIRQATFLAMRRALARLPEPPDALLVDGFSLPGVSQPQRALIRGDARALSIAAASIVAKVSRDRLMIALARRHPAYGFEQHMGYPTPAHLEALRHRGVSPLHRRTFAPVRALLAPAPATCGASYLPLRRETRRRRRGSGPRKPGSPPLAKRTSSTV